jgi:hypothetical protein
VIGWRKAEVAVENHLLSPDGDNPVLQIDGGGNVLLHVSLLGYAQTLSLALPGLWGEIVWARM